MTSRRVALFCLLIASAAFVLTALAARTQVSDGVDVRLEMAVHEFDSPRLDVVMKVTTALGSHLVTLYAGLCGVVLNFRLRRWRTALRLLIVTLGAALANHVLKTVFGRARPALFQEIAAIASFSFPSGHAMLSTSVYGGLALNTVRARPDLRVGAALATALLIGAVSLSRIYLGVHWPSDVFAGVAAGAALIAVSELALPD